MTRKVLVAILLASITTLSSAQTVTTPYNLTMTYPLISKDPCHLHGYRVAAGYQPQLLTWQKTYIYVDASYGHWWVPGANTQGSISIYSIAPIIRSYIKEFSLASPFVELSIGASYLSKTRLNGHNLGMHFSFQDQLGLGLAFGREKRLAVSLSALHYSNASLGSHNSGITVPLIINLNYRF